jgi:hypothetical protein
MTTTDDIPQNYASDNMREKADAIGRTYGRLAGFLNSGQA